MQVGLLWLLLQKLKRFCCSSCPYRSNFRSDVVRHIRHKHPTVECAAGVSKLDAVSAAASLADYMNTWARKKFVLHSRRRRCRTSQHGTSTTDQRIASSLSSQPVTPSASNRAKFVAPSDESPKTSCLEDRLVIDTEDHDGSCERDRRGADQQVQSSLSSANWPNSSECVADVNRCPSSTCHGCDCDCVNDRQEDHPVTDMDVGKTRQSRNDDRCQVYEYSALPDSRSHSAASSFPRGVDERSSKMAPGCLQGNTALVYPGGIAVNSLQKTYNPDHPRSVDVTDAGCRDVAEANEPSGLGDDASSDHQWSSETVDVTAAVKKGLMDVEERRPTEQQYSSVHTDFQPQRLRPLMETVPYTSQSQSLAQCVPLHNGAGGRRCWPVPRANDDHCENNMVDHGHLRARSLAQRPQSSCSGRSDVDDTASTVTSSTVLFINGDAQHDAY